MTEIIPEYMVSEYMVSEYGVGDVLDEFEGVDRFSELEDESVSQLNRAGFDDLTPVDTFLNANGNSVFVTEV